jgi:uncharacterized protein YjbI with pentapeptide repeats
MNKYVSKLFGGMFQNKQVQQMALSQQQLISKSPTGWREHWQAQGQLWRTEPEIDKQRQKELAQLRNIVPNIEQGIYPFKEMKLSRADVEWLLATHENGRGPVDWSAEDQHGRKGLDLRGADLHFADLHGLPLAGLLAGELPSQQWHSEKQEQRYLAAAHLEEANLYEASLEGANLTFAHLEGANLYRSNLKEADLRYAQLARARLIETHLEEANLYRAHLEDADLLEAHLEGADLTRAFFSSATRLRNVMLSNEQNGCVSLSGVHWSDVDLSVVDWHQIRNLGDEIQADQRTTRQGKKKDFHQRLEEYQIATQAYRRLAVTLQDQGLNEDAARFAHRACSLQRKIYWRQRNFWKWLGSAMLATLAGYGYSMWRILAAYAIIVSGFAGIYFALGMFYGPHLSFLDALLTSVTAFHGRVFSEPFLLPGEPQLWMTAFEAIAGLVIESVFIAMLVQRFFGK